MNINLKSIINVMYFIVYRLDSIMLLPRELRMERLKEYQSIYNISDTEIISLIQNSALVLN